MAKIEIKEMQKIEKQSGRMQEVVEATYSMVNSINGELF